jgi:small subunit ribosomal protein S15
LAFSLWQVASDASHPVSDCQPPACRDDLSAIAPRATAEVLATADGKTQTTSILPFYSLYTPAVNIYFELLIYYMEAKTKTIEQFKTHSKDTGSADVQIALLTERINHLTGHLQGNAKDHSSRRGLLMMVSQRRRLLDYLHNTDLGRYQAVTKKLKLRK